MCGGRLGLPHLVVFSRHCPRRTDSATARPRPRRLKPSASRPRTTVVAVAVDLAVVVVVVTPLHLLLLRRRRRSAANSSGRQLHGLPGPAEKQDEGRENENGETRHNSDKTPQARQVVQGPTPTVRIGTRKQRAQATAKKCAEHPQPAWLRLNQPHSFPNWHGARGEDQEMRPEKDRVHRAGARDFDMEEGGVTLLKRKQWCGVVWNL